MNWWKRANQRRFDWGVKKRNPLDGPDTTTYGKMPKMFVARYGPGEMIIYVDGKRYVCDYEQTTHQLLESAIKKKQWNQAFTIMKQMRCFNEQSAMQQHQQQQNNPQQTLF